MGKPKSCMFLKQRSDGSYAYGDCTWTLIWDAKYIENLLNQIYECLPLPIGGYSRLHACEHPKYKRCQSAGCYREAKRVNQKTGKWLCPVCWQEYERL